MKMDCSGPFPPLRFSAATRAILRCHCGHSRTQQDIPCRDKFVPHRQRLMRSFLSALTLVIACCVAAPAQTLLLKDGRKLQGKHAQIASVAENPLSPKTQAG